MINGWIDLRSDTVTVPSEAMRQAMANAEVGDDVFGEDPTVLRLEASIAERLGKEAALFVPSGTMSNQIGVRLHTRPGDELICEVDSHLYVYEGGGPAVLSGVSCRTVAGKRGILDPRDVYGLIRPDDIHQPRTRLLALENTHNRGGGSIYPLAVIDDLCGWAKENGLATHLDGARLMNAVVASGVPAERWVRGFDTVSVCFSKGLGAPVGSALIGPKDLIMEGRRIRKLFGGGMRQAGVIAAAALYALEHNVDRLADDHRHARRIAEAFERAGGFDVKASEVETNLVWVGVSRERGTASAIVDRLREQRILALALGPHRLRLCTHLNATSDDIDATVRAIEAMG